MFTVRKKIFIAFALAASLVSVAFGQQAQSPTKADTPSPSRRAQSVTKAAAQSPSRRAVTPLDTTEVSQQARPTPKAEAPAPNQPEYAETTDFKGKVFNVKHRDPSALVRAIAPLGSGFKGTMIRFEQEFKTITVRDFPENIAAMEEALKRLDTPQPPQPDIVLNLHILIASNVEGAVNQHPAVLNDVVKQLQATLNYKNYYLVGSMEQRVKDGTRGINGEGVAQLKSPFVETAVDVYYKYSMVSLSTASTSSGALTTEVQGLRLSLRGTSVEIGAASINTSLSAREGEKVVVGTASLKDKAVIFVLMAKVVK